MGSAHLSWLGHGHHSHDHAHSADDALRDSAAGIQAVKISLVVLGLTAVAQLAIVAISALVAAVEAVRRLIDPVPLTHLAWVAAAGVVGFLGNEMVALYRIRVGNRIGSAVLRADGMHARADGLTSLA